MVKCSAPPSKLVGDSNFEGVAEKTNSSAPIQRDLEKPEDWEAETSCSPVRRNNSAWGWDRITTGIRTDQVSRRPAGMELGFTAGSSSVLLL